MPICSSDSESLWSPACLYNNCIQTLITNEFLSLVLIGLFLDEGEGRRKSFRRNLTHAAQLFFNTRGAHIQIALSSKYWLLNVIVPADDEYVLFQVSKSGLLNLLLFSTFFAFHYGLTLFYHLYRGLRTYLE